ncbi:hypothetical protein ACFE04_028873 [Oxalis oulophora]
MISNPNLVLYACIAKGTAILVQYSSSKEAGSSSIESLAIKCLENIPPHHSKFSHTIHKRTYACLIDEPIVYYAIFDEKLDSSESSWFLNRAKFNFQQLMATRSRFSFDDMTSSSDCFQSHVSEIFYELLFPSDTKHSRNSSGESSALKKKTRLMYAGEANGYSSRDVYVDNKVEVLNEMHNKHGGNYPGVRQKVKQRLSMY